MDSMERLQVLEPEDNPQKSTWYDLIPRGQCPSARVGHNCLYLPPAEDGRKGKVVIVGGANPNGSFSDAYIIDLDLHEWDVPDWGNLLPRYEHASFIPAGKTDSIWVFGGAEQSGNRNCVQVLHQETGAWKSPKVSGSPPSPRTFHTSSSSIGDKLYVFGGGEKGSEPVEDTMLHVFDSDDMKWQRLKVKGDVPAGCAAHSAASCGKHIYIFGGMGSMGAMNTMYKYHTEDQSWTLLKFDSPLPRERLDHSMCIIPWRVRTDPTHTTGDHDKGEDEGCKTVYVKDGGDNQSKEGPGHKEAASVQLCLIFGGMSTEGELYSDCCVAMLEL
ncbi:rab9 effector protein with kelch motifs isoform X2 [Lissotriton helveticus]